jgi:hypothetical protein
MVMKKFRLFCIEVRGLSCCANSAGEFGLQKIERSGEYFLAPDDDIVVARRHVTGGIGTHGLFQPPPYAIADHGIADLLGHGVADARAPAVAPVEDFNEKKPPTALFATPDSQEFCALQKPSGAIPNWLSGSRQRSFPLRRLDACGHDYGGLQ